ncbi:hypothetical protein M3Y95_01051700 [Aphelenchoides besseyi]|nr:hypothetical protein M3Y95_01051700 [Aphelenchoides besseyi]
MLFISVSRLIVVMFKIPLITRSPKVPTSGPLEVASQVPSKPISRIQPPDYFLRFQLPMRPVNTKDPRIQKQMEGEFRVQNHSLNTNDAASLTQILRSLSPSEQDTFAQLCQQNSGLLSTELSSTPSTSGKPVTVPSDPAVKLPVEATSRNRRAQKKRTSKNLRASIDREVKKKRVFQRKCCEHQKVKLESLSNKIVELNNEIETFRNYLYQTLLLLFINTKQQLF